MDDLSNLLLIVGLFCFGYPFVMSWYWIVGALLFYFIRERHQPRSDCPPELPAYPLVSVLLPCFNESAQLHETFAAISRIQYPNFEVVAINDGSSDDTGHILDEFSRQMSNVRVANLVQNQGKSTALNVGALMARGQIIVCIDGDALIDPHALTWFVRRFQADSTLGAVTGNPRIRNRTSLLGRLQVGEFSSIIGIIKRTQSVAGFLFSVSGVICAFRKLSVMQAGMWSPEAITDDVDLTLRIQVAGWRVTYEPNALCWILMPETLLGLWRQRLRWSEGGAQASLACFFDLVRHMRGGMLLVWSTFMMSTLWALCMTVLMPLWILAGIFDPEVRIHFNFMHQWGGEVLITTYFIQAIIALWLDRRYEKSSFKSLYWIVWYPLLFWMVQSVTAVLGLCKAILRPVHAKGKWISPDRGIR